MLCRYLLQFWKRALLVLAFALGVTMFAIGDTPKAAGIEGVRITHAQLAPGVVELWQGDAATNVELAHEWRKSSPSRTGVWTYRLTLPAVQRTSANGVSQEWALYIPRAGNRLRLLFDGHELASFGDLLNGEEDYSPYPLLVKVPGAWLPALDAGGTAPTHELLVQVGGDSRRYTGLSAVWWGPTLSLQPRYAWRHLLTEKFFYLVMVLDGVFAVCALVAGYALRQKALVWFGVTSGLGAVHYYFWRETVPSLPFGTWLFAQDLSLAWNLLGMQLLCFHIMDMRMPRFAAGLKALLLIYYPVASLMSVTGVATWPKFWATNLLNLGIAVAGALVVQHAWRHRNYVTVPLAVFSTLTLPAVLWTQWNAWVSTNPQSYEQLYLTPYVRLLYMLVMTLCLGVYFLRTIHAQARSEERLKTTVAAQHAELTLFYEAQQKQWTEQTQAAERKRILHDMHDGLGARLLRLESIAQLDPVPQSLLLGEVRGTLDEFRLSIDAMEPYDGDLLCLLGQLRMRMQTQLQEAGITIHWMVGNMPDGIQINTTALAHVQRMIAEALTNVLKHAQARNVTISTSYLTGSHSCTVHIEDDGVGFAATSVPRGQGLKGMNRRASLIGASLHIGAGKTGGTCVQVTVPCV